MRKTFSLNQPYYRTAIWLVPMISMENGNKFLVGVLKEINIRKPLVFNELTW